VDARRQSISAILAKCALDDAGWAPPGKPAMLTAIGFFGLTQRETLLKSMSVC
jgi:hypothetical protein